jgi:GNAT superfamily N-acetyltransferase
MNSPQTCSDKDRLENYLRRCSELNYYHLGDLDDFFWPDTRWYISQTDHAIDAVVLLYTAGDPIVLLAIVNDNQPRLSQLLENLIPSLPDQVYAHLSPGLEVLFETTYSFEHHGEHYKMTLTEPGALEQIDTSKVISLKEADLPRLEALYAASYPGNWFNPRMLKTGQYVGIEDQNRVLLCAAGIHVYSPDYRVAALGNITTLPDYRGRGLATSATAGLCKLLLKSVDLIGLNVRTDNPSAIHAYQKTGFSISGMYNEWMLRRK